LAGAARLRALGLAIEIMHHADPQRMHVRVEMEFPWTV
jgi:hypothetical protein